MVLILVVHIARNLQVHVKLLNVEESVMLKTSIHKIANIFNILRISVCVAITLQYLLLMQPHYLAITYLCLYPYSKKLL